MKKEWDLDNINLEKLVNDQKSFEDFVYSPIKNVLTELQKRWDNQKLEEQVDAFLGGDIPTPLKSGFKTVLFRQLFSPNYEFVRFLNLSKEIGIEPMFLEYHDDKFTSNNPLKHCLGKMKFRNEEMDLNPKKIEVRKIIEFNGSDGKKIKEVETKWGQSLIEFHHEMLERMFPGNVKYLFDTSDWFHRGGENAEKYYTRYIALFVRHGILFENFVLTGGELNFVKDIFLPAFIEVWKTTNYKPIILPLLPVKIQDNPFWMAYPLESLSCVDDKMVI